MAKDRDWPVPIKPASLRPVSADTQVTDTISRYLIDRTEHLDHDPSQSGIHFVENTKPAWWS